MTKKYYGVFDRQAGKLRNGFVYSSYDFAKKRCSTRNYRSNE